MEREKKLKSAFHKNLSIQLIQKEILDKIDKLQSPNQKKGKAIRKKCGRCNRRERMKHKRYCKKCWKEIRIKKTNL